MHDCLAIAKTGGGEGDVGGEKDGIDGHRKIGVVGIVNMYTCTYRLLSRVRRLGRLLLARIGGGGRGLAELTPVARRGRSSTTTTTIRGRGRTS